MSKLKIQTIAIIDSGIGGISVLNQLINKNPYGNYIYFADNLNMPYGNKTKGWLNKRLHTIIRTLQQEYKADLIIIACNTASTCVDTTEYNNVIAMTFEENKTYFGTNLTKKNLINMNIVSDNCLAKQIEQNIFNKKKIDNIISKCVKRHKLSEFKEFVLGCTHYELVKYVFEKYCPNSVIKCNSSFIIDSINLNSENNEFNLVIMLSLKNKQFENKILSLIRR